MSSARTDPLFAAKRAFAAFLARTRSGEVPDLDALCASHPECAEDLRRLASECGSLEGMLGKLHGESRPLSFFGRGGSGKPPDPAALGGARTGDLIGDYRLLHLIAAGGQGQVWEAEQVSLQRRVALKLVHPSRINPRHVELFAREARAGGRLAHPNIVAVHAFGQSGGVHWIAEELVEGCWTVRDSIEEMRGLPELPATYHQEVAEFVAKLADALQAAHGAGVIHRDVKPQNILVSPEDQPKLTDFGLARITDESALSATGDFAGTYLYMSPEQVTAKRMGIDHRTDIFSLGVVLYEMLALQRPFEGDTTHQIAEKIVYWDPPDLHKVRSRIPVELAVICGKALEKRREDRYATMAEFAADLRRHLANEPILARPPGPFRRTRKWMLRNPTKSVAIAVAVIAFVVISALAFWLVQKTIELGETNAALQKKTTEAEASAAAEKRRADEVLRLSALQTYDDLIAEDVELWPAQPEIIPAYESWIERMQELVDRSPEFEVKREELLAEQGSSVAGVGKEESRWWVNLLTRLIERLEEVTEEETGLLGGKGIVPKYGCSVRRRLALAESLRDGFSPGGEFEQRWAEVLPEIRERYSRSDLVAQMGLVPIDVDPESEWWEFWHVLSGERPVRDRVSGKYRIKPESGIVLVLLPGGPFEMGSPESDRPREGNERLHWVNLLPFFISKYEVTQAQWERIMGGNPSGILAGKEIDGRVATPIHPVESMTWNLANEFADRLALMLPTEAQWEYACRAGTATPFYWGTEKTCLKGNENIGDLRVFPATGDPWEATWDDRYLYHAPVGSFTANGFGLFDMHGNVSEWCRDWDQQEYPLDNDLPGDGLLTDGLHTRKAFRGGGWALNPKHCRSAFRQHDFPQSVNYNRGLRVSRELLLD